MAQQVKVNVQIGGKAITHFTSLRIDQSLFTHHTFEIVVPFEDLESKTDFFFKGAHQSLCGKAAEISFEPYFKDVIADFKFLGVVTELALNNNSEMVNSYIIKGHSPTFLMEDGVQRRAFVKGTLGSIFGRILRDYPDNILRKSVAPKFMGEIDYKAQYDESSWDFLSRLAAEYGEWFYYDGQVLNMGKPGTKTVPFVVDGVQHFDMAISLKPVRFNMFHYNYVKHEQYRSAGNPVGLGSLGSFAYGASQGLFGQSSQLHPLRFVQVQAEIDSAVNAVNQTNAADLVRFQGSGENPNVTVGMLVDVTTQKLIKPGEYKKESVGKYRITAATHTVDNIGNYENFFEAIPDAAQFPPRNHHVRMPVSLPEIATVITNEDPLKLGRVKVQFHWPNQMEGKSSWVRVAVPYTGSTRGMLFIPEKDDQVMITYEANHVDFPIIVGSVYHKNPANNFWFDNNYQKIIRTKGGNKLVFKDKPGEQEVYITNANKKGVNFHISFKDDGVITLHTDNGLIQLEAKDIKLTAKHNIEMKAGNDILMAADNNFQLKASKEVKSEAGMKTDIKTNTGPVEVSGTNVNIEAKASATLKGMQAEVNGSIGAKLTGAMVEISGTMVRINS
jgi:type VI secretion system secreted protein VgrG